jgi:hypothetical protein
MRSKSFSITQRTFINARGLFKARSFEHAVQHHDGYRVRLLDRIAFPSGVVLMAVNCLDRTVYFQYAQDEAQAYRFIRSADPFAMPLVVTQSDQWFSPDNVAHHLALISNEEYLYWLIVSR